MHLLRLVMKKGGILYDGDLVASDHRQLLTNWHFLSPARGHYLIEEVLLAQLLVVDRT